jgi:beta-glucanase (GH16 family)
MKLNNCIILICLIFCQFQTEAQSFLRWSDEFNGNSLDTNNWEVQLGDGCPNLCGWGNNELEWYKREAIVVNDGYLNIKAKKEITGNSTYSSGRMRSLNKFDFTCGTVKISAKLPKGRGYWPAVWFLPSDNFWGTWPLSGEIDLLEGKGQEPQTIYGTIHYGAYSPNNKYSTSSYTLGQGNFTDYFHEFELNWSKDSIKWLVDGVLYASKNRSMVKDFSWPFDRNFHCIINLAVGGNFLGYPDASTPDTASLIVDYIRVYQDLDNMVISGPTDLMYNAWQSEFYVPQLSGATYNWELPQSATLISGSGSNRVKVKWGNKTDSIKVNIQYDGKNKTLYKPVSVTPDSCIGLLDDAENHRNFFWVGGTGTYRASVTNPSKDSTNSSMFCNRYYRNGNVSYDVLYVQSKPINDALPFENGTLLLKMKVYTTAPTGTNINLNFENRDKASKDYPSGRRSVLQAITTKTRAWEDLTFRLLSQPDRGTATNDIDQLVLLFAPNTNSTDVYYFDDIRLELKPCSGANSTEDILDFKQLIEVFPNPFSAELTISNAHSVQSVSLYGIDGKTHFENLSIQNYKDGLSKIPDGFYLLKLVTNNQAVFKKIQKRHE